VLNATTKDCWKRGNRSHYHKLVRKIRIQDVIESDASEDAFLDPLFWKKSWEEPYQAKGRAKALHYRDGMILPQPKKQYGTFDFGLYFQEFNKVMVSNQRSKIAHIYDEDILFHSGIQDDMPDGQAVVPIGKGFVVLEADFDKVQLLVNTGLRHWTRNQPDKMQTTAMDIGLLAKASLFPGNTSAFGTFIGKNSKGYPFHMERYEVLTG
jgi:hypothetical protein